MLYVIELLLGGWPRLEVWTVLRETPHSFVVKLREGECVIRKKGQGRRIFQDEQGAIEYLRAYWRRTQKTAEREVVRASYLQAASSEILLGFSQAKEESVDLVEKYVHETNNPVTRCDTVTAVATLEK